MSAIARPGAARRSGRDLTKDDALHWPWNWSSVSFEHSLDCPVTRIANIFALTPIACLQRLSILSPRHPHLDFIPFFLVRSCIVKWGTRTGRSSLPFAKKVGRRSSECSTKAGRCFGSKATFARPDQLDKYAGVAASAPSSGRTSQFSFGGFRSSTGARSGRASNSRRSIFRRLVSLLLS